MFIEKIEVVGGGDPIGVVSLRSEYFQPPIHSVTAKEQRLKQSVRTADCFASLAMTGVINDIDSKFMEFCPDPFRGFKPYSAFFQP